MVEARLPVDLAADALTFSSRDKVVRTSVR